MQASRPDPVQVPLREPLTALPAVLFEYQGSDVQIDSAEVRTSGVDTYLMRMFGNADGPVFSVYVGYYTAQNQDNRLHSPRNCLPGSGWQILTSESRPVDSGRISRYLIEHNGVRALVFYWYQGRGHVSASESVANLRLLRDGILSGRSEEALVRVVIPYSDRSDTVLSEAEADILGLQITTVLLPAMERVLP